MTQNSKQQTAAEWHLRAITLVELLVVVVIIAIIIVIAWPIYTQHAREARRMDAISALTQIQLAQENYRSENNTYGTLSEVWGTATTSDNGLYNLAITNPSASGYTITATATGDQANDSENGTSCSQLSISVQNKQQTRNPSACW